ncbi:MAG TPA: hypothetical protein VF440_12110 [Novosphingobium sp.]
MTDPKPLASLSPSLLARKGAARPAMRPQLQPLYHFREATARQIEDDLGWNDMGHEFHAPEPDGVSAQPEAIGPEPVETAEVVAINPAVVAPAAEPPPVLQQQEAIAGKLVRAVSKGRRSALADGRRAAFTLRLDGDRHLQLRLACTVSNRSAQQIVTEALDQYLAARPDLADLAARVGKRR